MYGVNQSTILNEVSFFGKPENMEKAVNVKILPSVADSGVVFKRVDLKENNIINLNFQNAYIENNELILKNEHGVSIRNVELLIASIWAAKIDNLIIEIDDGVLPYIDGTSESFSFLFAIGQIKELEKNKKMFEVTQDIGVRVDDFEVDLKPSKHFILNIKNKDSHFEFNANLLPFKDWLSRVSVKNDNKAKFDTISLIAIIFLSVRFSFFEANLKNYNKELTLNFFKNIFANNPSI